MTHKATWRLATVQAAFWTAAFALILAAWQGLVTLLRIPPYIIPSPGAAFAIMYENAPLMRELTEQTLLETACGYLLGAGIGFALAVLMAQAPLVRRLLYPALITSQAVPIVGIAAPLVIVFGFGLAPKLIIVAWIVFFPVVVNVLDGLARVDQDLINLARLLGGSRLRTFLLIRLPGCLGPLFSGLKIGASYAVTGAVIGEWTASSRVGLGTYLLTANAQMNTAGVYGAMLLMTLIGTGSFLLVLAIEHIATPWRHRATKPHWLRRHPPS